MARFLAAHQPPAHPTPPLNGLSDSLDEREERVLHDDRVQRRYRFEARLSHKPVAVRQFPTTIGGRTRSTFRAPVSQRRRCPSARWPFVEIHNENDVGGSLCDSLVEKRP